MPSAVLWATGKGKSLCYQLPPLMQSKTAIVVSPLLSLMADQVTSINGKFSANKQMNELPPACFLGSSQTDHRVEADAVAGRYRLVYLTPEKLASSGFLARLAPLIAKNSVSLLAVDEAHCTSEWGHDFRPEFMKIGMFRTMYPSVPIIALTATAVDRVRHDIVNSLQLHEPVVSISSLDRTNLGISVMRKSTFEKDVKQIIDFMKQSKDSNNRIGSTIIYVASKNEAERLCKSVSEALLASSPTVVGFYHGGLDAR